MPFMIPLASCDTTLALVVSQDKKSCCTLFWLFRANKCNYTIDNAISITWCHFQHQMHQEGHLSPHFNFLNQTNGVVVLMVPLSSPDADVSGITWPKSHVVSHFDDHDVTNAMVSMTTLTIVPMASHDQKCYVVPCFSHFDQMNKMVLLTLPLASHNADASANCIKWVKKSCCTSFQSSWPNKYNSGIT